MAAGLAVVATPVGALPEAFDERNVLFVEPGNTLQLASAILQLVQRPQLREQLGANNRLVVQQRFSLPAHAAQMDALFAGMLHTATR
jgi:glycosyltransferase involved in cell wall biosynthesis